MDPDRQPHSLPPATHRVLDTDDVDHARDEVAIWLAPHRLTPSAPDAALHVLLHYAQLGPIGIGGLSYGAPVEVAVPSLEELYLAEIPLWGRLRLRSGQHEMIATPRHGAIVNPTDELWKRWSVSSGVLVVGVDRAALLARAESWADRPLRGDLRFDTVLDATAGVDRTWLALVWALVRDVESVDGWAALPALQRRWTEALMDGLLLGHPSTHRHLLRREDEPAAGPRALRQLLEQLHAHPERPWTTGAMARTVGVGVRAVQKMFARHLDTTPQAYLRRLRLARAHADLVAAGPATTNVREIALRWGFTELGRFAADYRRRYGKTPLDTLRRG